MRNAECGMRNAECGMHAEGVPETVEMSDGSRALKERGRALRWKKIPPPLFFLFSMIYFFARQ